jgi:regulator of extracellular matrix RemA (YlzA/DUF370 family)
MHGTGIIVSNWGHRYISNSGLFDTKTSAMNRHENFLELNSSPFKQMRFNAGFTPELLHATFGRAQHTID